MDDLISRQAVFYVLENKMIDRPLASDRWVIRDIGKAIKSLPTVEPERPRGEWIDKGNWMGIECSRCKCHSRYVTPFCPQCGARMKGGEE